MEFFDCVTNDVVWTFAVPEDTFLYGGDLHGKEAIREMARKERDYIVTGGLERPPEFIASGDIVVMLAEQTYTILKSGVTLKSHPFATVMYFRDGLINRIIGYDDLSLWNAAHHETWPTVVTFPTTVGWKP